MDNQIIKTETLQGRWLRLGIAIATVLLLLLVALYQLSDSDPYVRTVLNLTGNPTQGHAIFQMNCAGCHGLTATGNVGPSLQNISDRKSKRSQIYQVISGKTPPMPQFQPSPQEMADLLSFLETL